MSVLKFVNSLHGNASRTAQGKFHLAQTTLESLVFARIKYYCWGEIDCNIMGRTPQRKIILQLI